MPVRLARDPWLDRVISLLRNPTGTTGLFPKIGSGGLLSYIADVAARTDATNNRFRFLNIMCLANSGANQTIANDTITVANYGDEEFDTHSLHDNSTNNPRITVPIAAKYAFWAIDFWDNRTDTGYCGCRYRKNGATFHTPTIRYHNASDGNATSSGVFSIIVADMAASDYMEHLVIQNSGGDVDLLGDGTLAGSSQFGCVYVGE